MRAKCVFVCVCVCVCVCVYQTPFLRRPYARELAEMCVCVCVCVCTRCYSCNDAHARELAELAHG